eukprot:GHRQ01029463.1.p1 GENE.GHRQ01029463.1~~GHRQ01029463.1.p1  ORF type:complete len:110 (+),score=30.67 GHRQ01029463.1:220-549(+)
MSDVVSAWGMPSTSHRQAGTAPGCLAAAANACLICCITCAGSAAPKIALPATNTLAPAAAAATAVSAVMPPSTSISSSGNCCRSPLHFCTASAMNFWPPKPGCTVSTST